MEELKKRLLHNVKDYKRLACIVLCAVMALMLIGCGKQEEKTDSAQDYRRFNIVSRKVGIENTTIVLQDKETGVCYLYVKDGYGGGLTVMYNADGTLYTGG